MKTQRTLPTLNTMIRFRQRWGFSQRQLAHQLQISRSMAAMIEQGRKGMTPGLVRRLLELDMKLAAESLSDPGPAFYPEVELVLMRISLNRDNLEIKELELRNKAKKLQDQLISMNEKYRETTQWMGLVNNQLKEVAHNQLLVQRWKKNELAASRKLLTCNENARAQVRCNMEALLSEAALYQSKHQELSMQIESISSFSAAEKQVEG